MGRTPLWIILLLLVSILTNVGLYWKVRDGMPVQVGGGLQTDQSGRRVWLFDQGRCVIASRGIHPISGFETVSRHGDVYLVKLITKDYRTLPLFITKDSCLVVEEDGSIRRKSISANELSKIVASPNYSKLFEPDPTP